MNDEQVRAAVDEIERALRGRGPGLRAAGARVAPRRRRELRRRVRPPHGRRGLLTVGFATVAWLPWSIGLLALVVAVAVDDHHRRTLRRPR